MSDYTIIQINGSNNVIRRESDQAYIPFDEKNKDYQEYLEWAAIEGNEADIEEITE